MEEDLLLTPEISMREEPGQLNFSQVSSSGFLVVLSKCGNIIMFIY